MTPSAATITNAATVSTGQIVWCVVGMLAPVNAGEALTAFVMASSVDPSNSTTTMATTATAAVKTPTMRRSRGEEASTASAAVTATSANAVTIGWASEPETVTVSGRQALRGNAGVRPGARRGEEREPTGGEGAEHHRGIQPANVHNRRSASKQEWSPVWHAGPCWSTITSSVSPSQSRRTSRTDWVLPDVSPLTQ